MAPSDAPNRHTEQETESQAEEALRLSDEQLRRIVENAEDFIYTHDLQGNFTFANAAATNTFGYTVQEVLQLNVAQIVDPEYLPLAQQKTKEKIEGSSVAEPYELLTRSKAGEPIWVEVSTRLLLAGGRPVGVQGIARDVTERKQLEEELRTLRQRVAGFDPGTSEEVRTSGVTSARCNTASHPDIPDDTLARWQRIVDLVARTSRVPAGLIMKVDPPQIEVFAASATEGNPYAQGERFDLNTGLYCETVMARRSPLLVPDALKDPNWDHNPDIEVGMVFHLGLPIQWPDGEIFGTICVLDTKNNRQATAHQELLTEFKEVIEADLQSLVVIAERKKTVGITRRRAEELAALQATVLHITAAQDLPTVLQTIVERATKLLGAAGGGMYLCDPDKQQLQCVVSYNTPRDYVSTVLQYGEGAAGVVAQTREPVIIDDYRCWSRRAAVYEVDQPFSAVLSVPMIWKGQVTGVLNVLEDVESKRFTQNDLDLLTLLGNHAAIAVENARLYKQAREEIIERKRAQEQLRVSLQEKEVLLQEIHHRVKNNLALVSSLLAWQSETIQDEKSRAAFQESQNRIRSIARIHEHLYLSPDLAQVDMAKYTQQLVAYLRQSYGSHDVSLTSDTADVVMDIDRAIPVALIINELVSNCMRHAFPAGRPGVVNVTLRRLLSDEGRQVELTVSDDGVGAPEELDINNIESLGLNVVRLLVRQLSGTLELDRSDGTTFEIVLPGPEQTGSQEK